MKAKDAETRGGIIRDLITMGYRRSESTLVQDEDVRGKTQECERLRVFGTDREEQSKILSQIRAHQAANHNYLEEGIRLLEFANKAYSLYLRQAAHEKARLLKIVQSNCVWDGVSPCPKYRKPFNILAEGLSSANWLPFVDSFRTLCLAPMLEMKTIFEDLQQLALTG
jgi:hypothetical protein